MLRPLERDAILRLFQQLHQDMEDDWQRASGRMICDHCGLYYWQHYIEDFSNVDQRLCDGRTVHL